MFTTETSPAPCLSLGDAHFHVVSTFEDERFIVKWLDLRLGIEPHRWLCVSSLIHKNVPDVLGNPLEWVRAYEGQSPLGSTYSIASGDRQGTAPFYETQVLPLDLALPGIVVQARAEGYMAREWKW